jgi:selenocysteine lyase/cysteine desulfurase
MNRNKGKLFEDGFLNQIRERFAYVESDPVSGKRIYLENAGGSLTLKKVVKVVADQTGFPDNAGRNNRTSAEINKLISKGKEDVMTLLGARSGIVVMGESTTANAFKILSSIIGYVPGDNVVTTNLDHPAIFDSTRILGERFNKEWRVAELSPESAIVKPESILRYIDSKTIVLALIHSSNITGTRNNVENIIQKAKKIKSDLFVLVDGAQHAQHSLIDVEELGCDVYLISSYKTFSKIGASFMYLSDRAAYLPHDKLLGKPETCWELGTREQAGYAAWSVVIDYLCWLGSHFAESQLRREQIVAAMEAIELHERALTHRILKGTEKLKGLSEMDGVTVYTAVDDLALREPIIMFNVKGMKSGEVVSYLGQKGIRVHNRISDAYSRHTLKALGVEECVRVSLAHYNTPEEVDTFLRTLAPVTK